MIPYLLNRKYIQHKTHYFNMYNKNISLHFFQRIIHLHYNIFPGTLKLLGPPKILLIISISGNTKCKYENDVYLHTYIYHS